jgi:ribonucleotide monophosphatase NagD (HAD superfamily)
LLHAYAGAFVAGLEYSAGVQAEIVGKPEKAFFHEAVKLLNMEPSATVMIGDV